MIDLSIIPECYIDTNLIETIVPTVRGYNHQKGAGTVTKLMQGKLNDKFAVGIVDRDKKQLKYVEEFDLKIDIGDLLLMISGNIDLFPKVILSKLNSNYSISIDGIIV